jgi:hypothetical protein
MMLTREELLKQLARNTHRTGITRLSDLFLQVVGYPHANQSEWWEWKVAYCEALLAETRDQLDKLDPEAVQHET